MSLLMSRQPTSASPEHLTVNGAFLQEIKESYSHVWDGLNRMLLSGREGLRLSIDANQWIVQLVDFRSGLEQVFRMEATYGYVRQTARRSQHAELNAAVALQQHNELYISLSELCEQFEEAQYRGTIIRDFPVCVVGFERFYESLVAHERLESELIRRSLGLRSTSL